MMSAKRLQRELADIKKDNAKDNFYVESDDENVNKWKVTLLPADPPFNKGAFKIDITFPREYPFKPPKITFMTKIYHPNIDEKGQICLPIISAEHWKPATKTCQVLQSLLQLISHPEPEHPLRGDVAEEFVREKKKFDKAAEEYTKKYAEKRSTSFGGRSNS